MSGLKAIIFSMIYHHDTERNIVIVFLPGKVHDRVEVYGPWKAVNVRIPTLCLMPDLRMLSTQCGWSPAVASKRAGLFAHFVGIIAACEVFFLRGSICEVIKEHVYFSRRNIFA